MGEAQSDLKKSIEGAGEPFCLDDESTAPSHSHY